MSDENLDIPMYSDAKPKVAVMDPLVLCERNIRRFVKKGVGFRKGETDANKVECRKLLAQWNKDFKAAGAPDRTEADGWDMSVVVPGFELAVASTPEVKPEFAQQMLIAKMDKQLAAQADIIAKQGLKIDSLAEDKKKK